MADKDINLHVKAKGADQARQQLDGVAHSTEQLGNKTEQANRRTADTAGQAANATEKQTEAASKQSSVLTGLTQKVFGMIGAWKGVEIVISLLDKMADRLRTIRDLQREVHGQSLSLLEAGQSFEVQTGTVGKQQEWATFLSQVQKAGRMRSIGDALTVATAFDIATGPSGGAAANQELLMQIAPMFGASGVSGQAGAQFIDYAATAGVSPSADAYQDFYAKVMAGFRSSRSKDFGQFLTGLQSGTTGMILQGASPEAAISMYATALSVTKNEAAAATLSEQITRLSSGAYAKPRAALEGFAGVGWGQLSADDQFGVLLRYAASLPESERVQQLTEAGFSPELAGGLSKIAAPDTVATLSRTRATVGAASGQSVRQQVAAFQETPLGKSRELEGQKALDALEGQEEVGGWVQRMERAEQRVKNLELRGKDNLLMDTEQEASIQAYDELYSELDEIARQGDATGTSEGKAVSRRARALQYEIRRRQDVIHPQADDYIPGLKNIQDYRRQRALRFGVEAETQVEGLRDELGGITIQHNSNVYNHQDVHFHSPDQPARPRIGPDDLN